MTDISRRALLAVAATTTAGALAACGASAAGDSAATPGAASGSSAGTAGAFPVTIDTQYGPVTVEKAPERVVVVGITEQDTLLALGVVPVATTEWYGEHPGAVWPWAQDRLGSQVPEVLSTADGFQYEKIAALRPDLIIGTNSRMTQEEFTKLSAFAPVITGPTGSTGYFMPWDEQTLIIAKALGREADGTKLVDDVKASYAAAAAAHPEFAGKVATFSQNAFYDGVLYVYPPGLSTHFLTMLGFTINPELTPLAPGPGSQAELSAENLGVIDTDVLVVAAEKPEDIPALMAVPTYARLDVVTQKRTVYTDPVLAGAIYFDSPLSLPYVVERLPQQLAAAVTGQAPAEIQDTSSS
ncbi:iron complex transport system substrate-binding protein [Quadrisphaera granulorum]|uniref:Iron complex transport system substrate-binding protein n=1 Tax=Quadrisphaera granulorum TaxID=317664 RepID=A0A315ZZA3_9ACTN|nr:ABC transporter substrate-binding protein [Quadrisphaera granulorum]PWJ50228.1 iron complex transport system substrate-binding protein [Quadrisphaera granulorum]SZE97994.1 iron complex transport system substrate-binding protein [Quadrisphaera granulorum]